VSESESSGESSGLGEIRVDRNNLYQEEVFTDLRVASVRRLTPIRPDGGVDDSRPVLFMAETQLMSQRGLLPVHGPIEAETLEEAWEKFPEAIQAAVERLMEEARELQREEASRIIVPEGPAPTGKIHLG